MSPSVERTEVKVGNNLEQSQHFITIRLNDLEVFDAGKFDELARKSVEPKIGGWNLKYIVCADTMYIFPGNLRHNNAESALRASGMTGQLQSAGYVWLSDGPDFKRTIDNYSTTLLRTLSQADSDGYKNTVIKEALGDFFQVT